MRERRFLLERQWLQAKVSHLETELGLTKAELESAESRESKVPDPYTEH